MTVVEPMYLLPGKPYTRLLFALRNPKQYPFAILYDDTPDSVHLSIDIQLELDASDRRRDDALVPAMAVITLNNAMHLDGTPVQDIFTFRIPSLSTHEVKVRHQEACALTLSTGARGDHFESTISGGFQQAF